MIVGEVTARREAVVALEVLGSGGRQMHIGAVLDTGFTDFLTLPSEIVQALALGYYTNVEVTLGDGSTILSDVYRAVVVWDSEERLITVHEADTDPLVGMSLLQGFHLGMDVVDGGRVSIAPLE